MKILLIEDEKLLSKALTKILTANNYSVDAAYNGPEGLSHLTLGNYDIVILDIMLPEMDGITVLKEARKKGVNTPVIILSAKSDIKDKVLGLDSGANYFLTKPFYTNELLAIIRAITRGNDPSSHELKFGNTT